MTKHAQCTCMCYLCVHAGHVVMSFSSTQLGGKNAGIVFPDVDFAKCLPTMIRSSFINQGEVCLTTSRIFVHESIFGTFIQKFVELAK